MHCYRLPFSSLCVFLRVYPFLSQKVLRSRHGKFASTADSKIKRMKIPEGRMREVIDVYDVTLTKNVVSMTLNRFGVSNHIEHQVSVCRKFQPQSGSVFSSGSLFLELPPPD